MSTVLLSLPDSLRGDLKEPWGSVFTDADALLAEAGEPLVAVGDVVTYHLEEAGRRPDVALVDEMTKRSAVEDRYRLTGEPDLTVENPAATLTEELLVALRDAIDADGPVRIMVNGEEDLAALPAIVAAPEGASVVYGQPDVGMVLVAVTPESKERARAFLEEMDGDPERAVAILD